DPALEHHGDPIGERADLVELRGHEEDGRALSALLEETLVHVLRRGDIEPACRLRDDDELGPFRELATEHDLLLIAAGEVGDDRPGTGRPAVVLGGEPAAPLAGGGR